METSGKAATASRAHGKHHQQGRATGRKDRRSATGVTGEPKKGGRGGKYTWSGDKGHEMEVAVMDSKDPNFQDPEVVEEVEEGK
ncbi:hypothetical protein QJS10_CPB20g00570 [Acorus calamus]|uniref:Programmed cell death protein 4-like n=1 Tax=Acorus calamus TaxID=4465 RepID=A0AAV9CA33_ACOCL|nr:hypothetical protein QJS10_CPB20g00570 [Acorus calamus]